MSERKSAEQLTDGMSGITGSTEKVERIREIIFGAQLREFTQKFDNLQHDLARLNRELEHLNEQAREQEKSFKKQVREEAERLAKQFHDHEQQQSTQFAELQKRQTNELHALDQKHSGRSQELTAQVQANTRDIITKLRELSDQINHTKVDRAILGDLLSELGSRLQAQVVVPLSAEDDLIARLSEELE